MDNIPELIAYIGRRMFERRLTDMSGGNISARDDERLYLSPRFAGAQKHWQLEAADMLSSPVGSTELLEHPKFTREGRVHLAIYENFPQVRAIIHAHPYNIQPFVAAQKAIKPVLESTQKFGVIELVEYAPAHSAALAENVVAGLKGKEDRIKKQAAAVLIPTHGIVVVGKDLMATIDALERIDWNAWCIIAGRLLA